MNNTENIFNFLVIIFILLLISSIYKMYFVKKEKFTTNLDGIGTIPTTTNSVTKGTSSHPIEHSTFVGQLLEYRYKNAVRFVNETSRNSFNKLEVIQLQNALKIYSELLYKNFLKDNPDATAITDIFEGFYLYPEPRTEFWDYLDKLNNSQDNPVSEAKHEVGKIFHDYNDSIPDQKPGNELATSKYLFRPIVIFYIKAFFRNIGVENGFIRPDKLKGKNLRQHIRHYSYLPKDDISPSTRLRTYSIIKSFVGNGVLKPKMTSRLEELFIDTALRILKNWKTLSMTTKAPLSPGDYQRAMQNLSQKPLMPLLGQNPAEQEFRESMQNISQFYNKLPKFTTSTPLTNLDNPPRLSPVVPVVNNLIAKSQLSIPSPQQLLSSSKSVPSSSSPLRSSRTTDRRPRSKTLAICRPLLTCRSSASMSSILAM